MQRKFDGFVILLGSMLLLRVSVFLLRACMAGQDASSPAASATPPTASSPSTSLSPAIDFEDLNKMLACFGLDDYQDAKRDNDPEVAQYASEVQETASEIKDPQWAEVATLPAEEAMKRLAALCQANHYQQ